MWRHIAGINPDPEQPGYKHFLIRPRPGGGLTWASGQPIAPATGVKFLRMEDNCVVLAVESGR